MTNLDNSIDSIISQDDCEPRLLELVSTLNGKLVVEENEEYRWIRDNHKAYYSILDKSRPERLVLPYLQTMMSVLLFVPTPKSITLLGAGGGGILRFFNESLPGIEIQAIDYDERIIDITEKYFLSDEDNKIKILNSDALNYLSMPSASNIDLLFVDLFAHGSIPKFFFEHDFYEKCRRCSGDGVIVFNLIIESESSFKVIMNLLLKVFTKQCLYLTIVDYKNIIVLAFSDDAFMECDVKVLIQRCESLRIAYNLDFTKLLEEIISTNVCVDGMLQF